MIDPKLKQAFDKIKEDYKKLSKDLVDIAKEIVRLKHGQDNFVTKLELQELREVLREPTTRSTTQDTTRSVLKSVQKRVLTELEKVQIKKAMKHYIEEGYRTNQMKDEIMIRFGIRETCFFKYLKELREVLREPTTRSTTRDTTRSTNKGLE